MSYEIQMLLDFTNMMDKVQFTIWDNRILLEVEFIFCFHDLYFNQTMLKENWMITHVKKRW